MVEQEEIKNLMLLNTPPVVRCCEDTDDECICHPAVLIMNREVDNLMFEI